MKTSIVALSMIIGLASGFSQKIDQIDSINGVHLQAQLNSYKDSLYFLTGEEPFYQNYPSIKESLLKNIENGIQEGSYLGKIFLQFGQWQASQLNLIFFKEQLYKITWYFKRGAVTDIETIALETDQQFIDDFGEPQIEKFPDFTIKLWEGKTHQLQTFKEGSSEYSIEFRDLELAKQVEAKQKE